MATARSTSLRAGRGRRCPSPIPPPGSLADEDAQAKVAGLLAFYFLQRAQPHADGEGGAFRTHGLGGIGASGQRRVDEVVQDVGVHEAGRSGLRDGRTDMARVTRSRQAGNA